ncbi:hypothetical protein GWK47_007743 [Chionoecetes opilio]|uniref:Uncharacterized protein n=1 Tax=Chionoecetes opilio TaxID=41210 RepID=A0A8J4Y7V6_CHIOP|nr:hypothetical protein GWK47_007743 [Chionoecetes opilio]
MRHLLVECPSLGDLRVQFLSRCRGSDGAYRLSLALGERCFSPGHEAAKECIGERPRSKAWFCLEGDAGENRGEFRCQAGWKPGPAQGSVTLDKNPPGERQKERPAGEPLSKFPAAYIVHFRWAAGKTYGGPPALWQASSANRSRGFCPTDGPRFLVKRGTGRASPFIHPGLREPPKRENRIVNMRRGDPHSLCHFAFAFESFCVRDFQTLPIRPTRWCNRFACVESLFTNVPVDRKINYIIDGLYHNHSTPPLDVPETVLRGLLECYTSGLTFTIESSSGKSMPFLDILVTQQKECFNTNVYVKPTNPGHCLNGESYIPQRYKDSTIGAYIRRALTHCSTWQLVHKEIYSSPH